jgi:hypothetical protein
MGIKYHPSIGTDKLREKVNESLVAKEPTPTVMESTAHKRMKEIKNANKLVRIRLTCMDPNRKGWKGDYFTVMNSTFGTIKKFVPFNTVWHVPQVILKQIKSKNRQEFYEENTSQGMKVKRSRMVPMFAIEELPDLTIEELRDLANKQALNRSIDE